LIRLSFDAWDILVAEQLLSQKGGILLSDLCFFEDYDHGILCTIVSICIGQVYMLYRPIFKLSLRAVVI
jgi:hypothetical protein